MEEEYHSSVPVIGKPAWQHFYRYLCEGHINPQNQGILLQMIFLKLSMDLTIISGHFWQEKIFSSPGITSKSLLKPVVLVNAEDSSCVHDLGDWWETEKSVLIFSWAFWWYQ